MTDRRRRDVADTVEELSDEIAGADRTVREWVNDLLADGWSMSFDEGQDGGAEVLVATMGTAEVWVPEREVPSWVDRDALPVEA